MEQNRDKSSNETPKWVWDAEKSQWVEASPGPPAEESAKITEEGTKAEESAKIAEEENKEEVVQVEALDEGWAAEAVEPSRALSYKGVLVRLGGAIVDFIILFLITVIISYIAQRAVGGIPDVVVPIYGLLYFVGFWTWRGQTPGKMLIRARVVRADGSAIGIGRALLRYIFYLIPLFGPITYLARQVGSWTLVILPIAAILVLAFNRDKRGIHDFIAGTVVIDSSAATLPPEQLEFGEDRGTYTDRPDTEVHS